MRILVRDGRPLAHDLPGCEYEFAASCPHWRPLDKPPFEKHPEDREAREACLRWARERGEILTDGFYELVEEHGTVEGTGREPRETVYRKTLRRVGDGDG